MQKRSSKQPEKDTNTSAKRIVDQASATPDSQPSAAMISQVMREMGRKGGLKGGRARADKLSARAKREIAKMAAIARWEQEETAQYLVARRCGIQDAVTGAIYSIME